MNGLLVLYIYLDFGMFEVWFVVSDDMFMVMLDLIMIMVGVVFVLII